MSTTGAFMATEKLINTRFSLCRQIIGFYKKHIGFVSEHAVDPDKRRYATRLEAVRHYIDIDHWGEYPFDNVPRYLTDAVAQFSDIALITGSNDTMYCKWQDRIEDVENYSWSDTTGLQLTIDKVEYLDFFRNQVMKEYYEEFWMFSADSLVFEAPRNDSFALVQVVDQFSSYGILPYHLVSFYHRLTKAFESGDVDFILRTSADMGHYVGDAHVPLHTTENYNGAMSNQIGIHAFWESRIPELMAADEYDFFVGKAEYIENPREYFWDIVLTSHSLLDSVLLIEKRVRASLREDQIYCFENRLERVIRTECEAFSRMYADEMKGMVERRMTESIQSIGSVWFSAWVDAGQPQMIDSADYNQLTKQTEEWNKLYQSGESIGRKHGQ